MEENLTTDSGGGDRREVVVGCRSRSIELVKVETAESLESAEGEDENRQSAVWPASGHIPEKCDLHDSVIIRDLPLTVKILEECRDSIMAKNHLNQTALHLAVITDGGEAVFKVLLDEAVKQGKEDILLQQRDGNGDSVLHVATACKRNQIIRWLVRDNDRKCSLVQLNSMNGKGLTAKDIYDSNPNGFDSDVTLLINQGCVASTSSVAPPNTATTEETKILFLNSLLVVLSVSAFLAASIYTSLFNLNSNTYTAEPDHRYHIVRARLMLIHPERLPGGFCNIVLMTLTFTVSIIITVFGLCRTVNGWPLCYQVLPLLGLVAFFLSFAFHLQVKVPKFWLAAFGGTDYYYTEISSYWFVWLIVIFMVLVVLIFWLQAKVILMLWKTQQRPQRSSR